MFSAPVWSDVTRVAANRCTVSVDCFRSDERRRDADFTVANGFDSTTAALLYSLNGAFDILLMPSVLLRFSTPSRIRYIVR